MMSNISKKLPLEGMPPPVWASELNSEPSDSVASRNAPSKVKKQLEIVRSDLEKHITTLVSRLGGSPLIFDENRFAIVKNFLLLCYLIGEMNILFASVWRYSFIDSAWNIISPSLADAIEDVEKIQEMGESLMNSGADITSLYFKGLMKNYHKFLIWFDSSLERLVSEVTELVPFEIRLIDILSCCPTVDFELLMTKPDHCKSKFCSLVGTYKILNLPCVYDVPDFSKSNLTSLGKQSKLIKYVRDAVRCDNSVYLQNIINDLLTSEYQLPFLEEDQKLEKLRTLCVNYERVLSEVFQLPVHNSYNTAIEGTRYYCDLYKRQLRYDENVAMLVKVTVPILSVKYLPLILRKSKGESTQESSQSRKENATSVSKLKEYCLSQLGTIKPEVELKLNCSNGSVDNLSEVIFIGKYDYNNEFDVCIKKSDGSEKSLGTDV